MIPDGYIPLREALYAPDGLHPYVSMADVPRVLGAPIWRKGRYGRFRRAYVSQVAVERVRQQIEMMKRDVNRLIG
jgi:hypothetical protein